MRENLLRLFGLAVVMLGFGAAYLLYLTAAGETRGFDLVVVALALSFGGISLLLILSGLRLLLADVPSQVKSLAPNWVKLIGGAVISLLGISGIYAGLLEFPKSAVSISGGVLILILGIRVMKPSRTDRKR